ncbi:hypothetical protein SAMN05661096_01077 [Marivirga sericea]|uniref:Dolichyl-phosphate-mannose-protein mannosyltransferase n=1 Tax=Marivirga sericea TaxID=1028 RepID=A0A1X7IY62_9BACT|nr:hypothetical protein [Marivirga sericea]SMG20114.1 hypothetical protein SAMN05661096_01077 [Marivirga sericea]
MKPIDFLIAPVTFSVLMFVAYGIRDAFADQETKIYFFPALLLKMLGAIGVGLIYQFYYGGGDTYTYFTHGSSHIVDAFYQNFSSGLKLLTANGEFDAETYQYSSKIWMYRDTTSYFIVRIASIFGVITYNSYAGVALFFAFFSFWGLWMMYQSFCNIYPELKLQFAIAIFFIPTVFFWGSGILKDTVTLGATGLLVYAFIQVFFERKKLYLNILLLIAAIYIVTSVKLYIFLCLMPALILWYFFYRIGRIKSLVLRVLVAPFLLVIGGGLAYFVALKAGEDNNRYALDQIAETAQVTAYDIRYWTGRDAGSGYSLGELDGTFGSMIRLAPQAVNVSLFRPYLWEVNNPLMLLSAMEAVFLLGLTIRLFYRNKIVHILQSIRSPIILFCLIFAIIFAFGVGISTYNFGTLSRYRIVMVPFYVMAIYILDFHAQAKKESRVV